MQVLKEGSLIGLKCHIYIYIERERERDTCVHCVIGYLIDSSQQKRPIPNEVQFQKMSASLKKNRRAKPKKEMGVLSCSTF